MCICRYFILNYQILKYTFCKFLLISFLISVKIGEKLGKSDISMLIYTKSTNIYKKQHKK